MDPVDFLKHRYVQTLYDALCGGPYDYLRERFNRSEQRRKKHFQKLLRVTENLRRARKQHTALLREHRFCKADVSRLTNNVLRLENEVRQWVEQAKRKIQGDLPKYSATSYENVQIIALRECLTEALEFVPAGELKTRVQMVMNEGV